MAADEADIIICLGDVTVGARRAAVDEALAALPGTKILVAGNHDMLMDRPLKDCRGQRGQAHRPVVHQLDVDVQSGGRGSCAGASTASGWPSTFLAAAMVRLDGSAAAAERPLLDRGHRDA